MPATAVVGANWGDEGKGKITDYLAAHTDFVVRFQGGNNAGHTIINEFGKFALHLLPSGVFYPAVINVIGPGVALHIRALLNELQALRERSIPTPQLKISNRAQVLLPHHQLLDGYEEERLGDRQFGSTKKGIAPFYADKYLKLGVQVADLYDPARLRDRLEQALVAKNVLFHHLYHKPTLSVAELVDQIETDAAALAPYVCDTLSLPGRGQTNSGGRPTRRAARPGSRHLSLPDFFFAAGWLCQCGCWYSTPSNHTDHRCDQSLF